MTESFKQQLQELIDQAAVKIVAKLYDVSNEAANNFPSEIYTVKQGCDLLIPLLMKAVEQRDDAIWNRFRTKEEYSKVFFATDLADIMDKELLNILKGEK